VGATATITSLGGIQVSKDCHQRFDQEQRETAIELDVGDSTTVTARVGFTPCMLDTCARRDPCPRRPHSSSLEQHGHRRRDRSRGRHRRDATTHVAATAGPAVDAADDRDDDRGVGGSPAHGEPPPHRACLRRPSGVTPRGGAPGRDTGPTCGLRRRGRRQTTPGRGTRERSPTLP
jgi:hypothetical protein